MVFDSAPERYILAFLAAFLLAVCVTPLVREVARYRSILDAPNDRSSHSVPVPRLGGVAIVTGTFIGGLMIIPQPSSDMVALGVMSLLMVVMGLVDDVRGVRVSIKYLAQLIAAITITFWLEPYITFDFPFGDVQLGSVTSMALAAFFILAVVNALNFMDGIDGIASGMAIIVALGAIMLNGFSLLAVLLPLIASLAGFLCWNYNPASIFMGDGGSQLVGFILAVGLLFRPDRAVDIVPVLIVLTPILVDTGFTLIWRIMRRENIFEAHREHLYQRLVASGYAHRSVATLYFVMTGLCALLSFGYRDGGRLDRILVLFVCLVASVSFVVAVLALERRILRIAVVLPSAERSNIRPLTPDTVELDTDLTGEH